MASSTRMQAAPYVAVLRYTNSVHTCDVSCSEVLPGLHLHPEGML